MFLNLEEIKTLMYSSFPNMKADVIASKLKHRVIVGKKKKLYTYQQNKTYTITYDDITDELLTATTKLIELSCGALKRNEMEELTAYHLQIFNSIKGNASVKAFLPQLKKALKSDVVFNITPSEIHFQNGYMDLSDLQFKQRDFGEHFITNFIQRDYKPSSKAQRNEVMGHINKIFPVKADFDCVSLMLGSALTGKSCEDQDLLILIGEGSSGKSFIMELTGLAIGNYLQMLKGDTFSMSNTKTDKILNTFITHPEIRITWINEMSEHKMDDGIVKSFVDGEIITTILFEDGVMTMKHTSKPFFTMNTMPNFKPDSGMVRRIKGCTSRSKFTSDINQVDLKNNVYLLDKSLLSKITQQGLLDAWFDILCMRGNAWLNGETAKYSENFEETKQSVVAVNDIIQDFIDVTLVITQDGEDRIGKKVMYRKFRELNPKSFMTDSQIMTSLIAKKIQYSPKCRADQMQGCYMFVKLSDQCETLHPASTVYGFHQDDYKQKYDELLIKYNELLNKVEAPQTNKNIVLETVNISHTCLEPIQVDIAMPVKVKKLKKIIPVVEVKPIPVEIIATPVEVTLTPIEAVKVKKHRSITLTKPLKKGLQTAAELDAECRRIRETTKYDSDTDDEKQEITEQRKEQYKKNTETINFSF